MSRSDQILLFTGAQLLLVVFSLGIGVLIFTLAPLMISVAQLPLNIWLFIHKYEEGTFWRFVRMIHIINICMFVLLVVLIQIFGRRYFMLFLDINAWSF